MFDVLISLKDFWLESYAQQIFSFHLLHQINGLMFGRYFVFFEPKVLMSRWSHKGHPRFFSSFFLSILRHFFLSCLTFFNYFGYNQVNISFVVNDSEAEQCVKALHKSFFESGDLPELIVDGEIGNGSALKLKNVWRPSLLFPTGDLSG